MRKVMLVVATLASALALPAQAQLDVQVVLAPPNVPFHKQATFSIVVEAPAGADVRIPDMRDHFGDLQVYGLPDRMTETIGEGRVRITASYVLDPVHIRDHVFAPVEVQWGEGNVIAVPSPMFRVRDLTPEEIEEAQRFEGTLAGGPGAIGSEPSGAWRWWAVGAAIVAAAALLVLWVRLRGLALPDEAGREPWALARERLASLAARKLLQRGRYVPYYVDLSAILRYYIEGRFDLRAPERTTPEFLNEIAGEGYFTPEQEVFLARFLRLCDRVKFAQFRPDLEAMARSFEEVELFVEETVPRPEGEEEDAVAA